MMACQKILISAGRHYRCTSFSCLARKWGPLSPASRKLQRWSYHLGGPHGSVFCDREGAFAVVWISSVIMISIKGEGRGQ